ncbi:MAG: signal peptidase II [Ruminococcus sp.]|nr:signal peptidase II [Ruminococcus sp.]
MRKEPNLLIFSLIVTVVLVLADQLIKLWAVGVLQEKGTIPFLHIGNFEILDLTYLENNGAVFGSFAGMRWFLVGIVSVMLLLCIWGIIHYRNKSKLLNICLVLILSGGIGNLIDRLFRKGLVVDYIEIKLFNFAIFNFADCCVVIGIALFIFYVLFIDGRSENNKDTDAKASAKEELKENA